MATAASDGRDQLGADQRVGAAPGVDRRDRDDRQGQQVGQEPLVEVDRETDDQRDEPGTEQREGQRIRPEAQRQEPEPHGPDQGTDCRPPVDRPPGRHLLLVMFRPAGRETIGREPEDEAGGAQECGERVQVVSRPWRRPARARPGSRVRRRSTRAARTAAPCGSTRCRRCRGGPTAWSRTRG